MKILITTDLYTVTTNGVVTSVNNLREELCRRGHEVRILTLSADRHSHREGDVTYIASMPLGVYPDVRMPLCYHHKLIRELIKWRPDVIHSQCEFFSFGFAKQIAKRTHAPIVHTYHTLYEQYVTYVIPFERLGQRMMRAFVRARLRRAACVIAPTAKVERALKTYRLEPPIRVIPSGISLEQHRGVMPAEERIKKRAALGLSEQHVVLLNLGRLGTEKNLDELLRFFAKAIEKKKELRLLIVGDGPAKKHLEKLSVELGVDQYVIFTGMVEPSVVQEFYRLGDLFVNASTSETQGLTYIEATANGLPLLCRRDPCLEEVLIPGENGYDYADGDEFLTRLEAIVEDPSWRSLAGQNSRKAAERFDKSVFGEAVETTYCEVVGQKRTLSLRV